jgi:hypothetical protein
VQLDEKIVKITNLESISEQNDTEFPVDQRRTEEPAIEVEPEPIMKIEEVEKPDYEGLIILKSNEI